MIAILKGGNSAERKVSLLTAKSVAESLVRQKITYKEVDAANKYWLKKVKELSPEMVVNTLHGTFGEDGEIQSILEKNSIPFTGSGAKASALTFNKIKTKRTVANKLKIRVPRNFSWSDILPFPIVVKPNQQGSSFGVSIVRKASELKSAITSAQEYSGKDLIILEEYIEGKELTCGIIDVFGKIAALPLIEIVPQNEFFDYQSKYSTESGCEEICPARIPDKIALEVQEKSRQIHQLLGLKQYSRMDWILRDDELYFLEANSLPGMTPTSLLPKELTARGIGYDNFIRALIHTVNSTPLQF
jgi:D-alanine-D-alanine ligase